MGGEGLGRVIWGGGVSIVTWIWVLILLWMMQYGNALDPNSSGACKQNTWKVSHLKYEEILNGEEYVMPISKLASKWAKWLGFPFQKSWILIWERRSFSQFKSEMLNAVWFCNKLKWLRGASAHIEAILGKRRRATKMTKIGRIRTRPWNWQKTQNGRSRVEMGRPFKQPPTTT